MSTYCDVIGKYMKSVIKYVKVGDYKVKDLIIDLFNFVINVFVIFEKFYE